MSDIVLCLLQVEADAHHQRRYSVMGMVEPILALKVEEQSLEMQVVKPQIKMTSFRIQHRVFSFEETVYPWEPG